MKRAFLAVMLVLASTAHAEDDQAHSSYRAVVDRVDLEPASITGLRLRVYLSALSIGGQLLDLTDPKSIKLYLGTHEKKVPFALGRFEGTDTDTAIVFLVQTSIDFGEVLPLIADALDREVLANLGDHTQVAVLPYGEATGSGKLGSVKSLRGKLGQLTSDGSAGDPALLDTLDRALRLLRRVATDPPGRPLRKMIVVIGDGRDRAGDRDRVTRAGKRADKEGVRIHTIAFSANDVRRPMLALGELSKRSLGTFRWVRTPTAESWAAAFRQLRDEIQNQYVLTYFVTPGDEVAGKRLHVVTVGRTQATSNEVKVPREPTCAGEACPAGYCADDHCLSAREEGGRGVLGWLLLVGGIGVGALVLLGVIGFLITKAQQTRVPMPPPGMAPGMPGMQVPAGPQGVPAGVPGVAGAAVPPTGKGKKPRRGKAAPAAVPPGFLPNGRPVPVLMMMSGPRSGERIQLRHGFWIGKQPGCDLLIEDGYTSSHHAQIGMDASGNCVLYDRGSTNGTFVNGVRIGEQALQHGATIRIGSTELRFLAQ